jgi:hypothetical protein
VLNLLEAAKSAPNQLTRGVVELFAQTHPIIGAMGFNTISGPADRFEREGDLGTVAFRALGEGFTEDTGSTDPASEPVFVLGGDADADLKQIDWSGEQALARKVAMKTKHLAHLAALKAVKGSNSANPREPDGFQARCVGDQLIPQGSTSGGDPLSISKLDEVIDAVVDPTHLIMTRAMRRRLNNAARDESVGGRVEYTTDSFGRRVTSFDGLPILIADVLQSYYPIMGFNEAGPGGGATSTSIYVASFTEDGITGTMNSLPDVRNLGELESKPSRRVRIDWTFGISQYDLRSLARLWGISDAAVVA